MKLSEDYRIFFLRIRGPTLSPVSSLCFMCDLSQTGNWNRKKTKKSEIQLIINKSIFFNVIIDDEPELCGRGISVSVAVCSARRGNWKLTVFCAADMQIISTASEQNTSSFRICQKLFRSHDHDLHRLFLAKISEVTRLASWACR